MLGLPWITRIEEIKIVGMLLSATGCKVRDSNYSVCVQMVEFQKIVTVSAKTILNGTFCIMRNTDLSIETAVVLYC